MKLNITKFGRGIIVNTNDPLKNDRVQVRVVGLHPSQTVPGETVGIENRDLPWLQLSRPVSAGSISGVGSSGVGAVQQGQEVIVMYFDEFCREGFVMGAVPTSPEVLARRQTGMNGFSDPTGQFPRRVGSSTSYNAIDIEAARLTSAATSINLGLLAAPNAENLSWEEKLDDNPNYNMFQMLSLDEGSKSVAYQDSLGFPTIGIGHLIISQKTDDWNLINQALSRQIGRDVTTTGGPAEITKEEIANLFLGDISSIEQQITKYPLITAALAAAGENLPRQMAIKNMAFNLGAAGLAKFTTTLSLMAAGNWKEAAKNISTSLWRQQVKGRGARIQAVLASGNLLAYGVTPPATTMMAKARFSAADLSRMEIRATCSGPLYEAKEWVLKQAKAAYAAIMEFYGSAKEFAEEMGQMMVDEVVIPALNLMKKIEEVQNYITEKVTSFINTLRDTIHEYIELGEKKAEETITWIKKKGSEVLKAFTPPSLDCDEDESTEDKESTKARVASISTFAADINPWDPAPADSNVYWIEDSYESYTNPEYTKNDVKTTASGHIMEFDDSPGFERINLQHSTGTRTTFAADGTRHMHTSNDMKDAVRETRYMMTGGDKLESIGGNENVTVIGNSIFTVNADQSITVQGNDKINIFGSQDVLIKGDQNIKIEGNQTCSVEGNVVINTAGTTTVNNKGDTILNAEANVQANVKGNMTQKVDGDYVVTAANIDMRAQQQFTIDGSRVDVGL